MPEWIERETLMKYPIRRNHYPESAKLNSKNSNATRTVIPNQKRYQNACKKSIIRAKRA